jgi:hypothetical protein
MAVFPNYDPKKFGAIITVSNAAQINGSYTYRSYEARNVDVTMLPPARSNFYIPQTFISSPQVLVSPQAGT